MLVTRPFDVIVFFSQLLHSYGYTCVGERGGE